MKLPLYKITVNENPNDETGIDFVSLVDYPAIESNFIALKDAKKLYFNTDKQMLYGAILIPGKEIYRNDNGKEYNVVFEESEVIKLVRKFQAQKKTVNLNYQHQADSQLKEAVIQEIWLTGKNDKSKDFGFDFPVNTAMVGVYIGDKDFWLNEVKTGNVKGFSIEGWLDMEIKNKINNMKQKFAEAATKDGLVIKTDAEAMQAGVEVYTVGENGSNQPIPDGEYTLESGDVVVIQDNKILEIKAASSEELDAESVEVIQKAVKPLIDALKAELAAIKVAFENKPGTTPKVETTEPVQTGLSKVKQLINKK